MAKQNGGNTVKTVEALVRPVIEEMGLRLWDVRYEKEGPDWFLRIYIDRVGEPLDIDTVEAATRAVNPVLDAADPIEGSYYMELGSPGLGRRLTRDEHYAALAGQKVLVHLIRADEQGRREISGILRGKAENVVTLQTSEGEAAIAAKDIGWCKLCDDEDLF